MAKATKAEAAAIYCRISQDRLPEDVRGQRNAEDFVALGVKRQEQDCRRKATANGWPVAKVYIDNDVSAWNGKRRGAYREMLDDIAAGAIDAVVVWHVDRLHRQMSDLVEFLKVTRQAGIEENLDTCFGRFDLSNGDSRFMLQMMVGIAEKESFDKSRRIRRKMEELAREGKGKGGGTRPFGFKEDRVTLDPTEAKLVREAAKRILAGETLTSVCADWTRRGVKTVSGTHWTTGVLRQILMQPRSAGLRQHRGELMRDEKGRPVKAEWSAIFDEKTHRRLAALLGDPSRFKGGNARRYLLTGMLYCSLCDTKLVARPRADKSRCYVCASGVNFHGCGKLRSLSDPLEELVRDAVFDALGSQALTKALRSAKNAGEDQQELIDALRADEEMMEQFVRDYADRLIDRAQYLGGTQRVRERIETTRRELARNAGTRVVASVPSTRKALEKAWEERGLEWRRSLLSLVLDRVVLHPALKGRNFFDPERVELVWRV